MENYQIWISKPRIISVDVIQNQSSLLILLYFISFQTVSNHGSPLLSVFCSFIISMCPFSHPFIETCCSAVCPVFAKFSKHIFLVLALWLLKERYSMNWGGVNMSNVAALYYFVCSYFNEMIIVLKYVK